jgi:hypothetical protein
VRLEPEAVGGWHAVSWLLDARSPPAAKARAHHQVLGERGVAFMAGARLASSLRKGFSGLLNGVRFLLRVSGTCRLPAAERWFGKRSLRPTIVGDFEDGEALSVERKVQHGGPDRCFVITRAVA